VAKDDLISLQGQVTAVHSVGLYRVQCDPGHEVLAQLSGRMRRFRIRSFRATASRSECPRTTRPKGSSRSANGRRTSLP
jgi:hypothetical protein